MVMVAAASLGVITGILYPKGILEWGPAHLHGCVRDEGKKFDCMRDKCSSAVAVPN